MTRAAWLGVVLVLGLAGVALARRRVPPDLEVADARLQAEAGRALKMGLALLQRGRTAQAVKYLEKVAELESTLRDRGRYFLALVRLERGDLEGMNQALTQLDFAAIERAEAYDLGEALERRGQLDEACSVFERLYLTDVQFRDVETRLNALRKRVEQFSGDEVANLISRRILDSRFRSVRAIGSGGMGFVYEALDEGRGGQRVAVKVLSPFYANTHEAYTRFVREAQGLAALEHPNLVQVFDVFQQNLPYYSMEFVESEDLKVILEREGRLEEPAAVRILEAVCAGLGHAHDHGVTHRDVKPSNVLVLTDGAVKVIDFGVAKFDDETEMTITGQVLGTPLYMSPEQVKGVEVDHRSDIYSVGVLAYTLLAGVPPFETALERGYEDAPPLPEGVCSPPVARAVARALARDVEARYQHLEDLRADLRSA